MAENKHRYPANWKQIRAEQKHAEKIIVKNCEKAVDNHFCLLYNDITKQTGNGSKELKNDI